MLDTVIGPIENAVDEHTFRMYVTHVGIHNKYQYNSFETVLIESIDSECSTMELVGCKAKCSVKYRDQYNRLLAKVEIF